MWVIGIDEAGYGPNLGPLVMSAVVAESSCPIRSRTVDSSCAVRTLPVGL